MKVDLLLKPIGRAPLGAVLGRLRVYTDWEENGEEWEIKAGKPQNVVYNVPDNRPLRVEVYFEGKHAVVLKRLRLVSVE